MGKSRLIFSKIDKYKSTNIGRIIVLTGARQVGKTTLVRECMPQYEYISIEDPHMRGRYVSLTANQWHQMFPMAALDEIQKEPQLVESIKATYDIYNDVHYILLGSSQLLLLNKVKESLAGRCLILDMYPLTLPELATNSISDKISFSPWQNILIGDVSYSFLPDLMFCKNHVDILSNWEYYSTFGGYPALVSIATTDEERKLWLYDYVRTYLERDIRDIANFRDLEPFVKLMQLVALQTGQTINVSSISRDIDVSCDTISRFLTYLDISYQTITLQAWTRNKTKRLTKAPKIHIADIGVLKAITKSFGTLTGNEFESLIVAEIFKQTKYIMPECSFYHLRTQDGLEIDLLVETPNGYYAFEVKMTEHAHLTDAKHLKRLPDILDRPLLHSFVISNDTQTKKLTDNITAINAAMFLS